MIKSRWIDINKGDDVASLYRSRLVGKEFADKKVDGLFAGTPLLAALRFLVHEAATVEGEEEEQEKVIMVNEVARAFFEAKAIRKLCVELPSECAESCGAVSSSSRHWSTRCCPEIVAPACSIRIGVKFLSRIFISFYTLLCSKPFNE